MKDVSFIILGPQASGKGSQSQLLAEKLKLPLLSTGAIAKRVRDKKDKLGKLARSYYDKGKLFPDDLIIKLLIPILKDFDYKNGLVLEGIPRNKKQVEALNKLFQELRIPEPRVIYLKINKATVYERIKGRKVCNKCNTPYLPKDPNYKSDLCNKCGGKLIVRPDDGPEAIKKRLDIYYKETEPVIKYYRQKKQLIEIDGELSIKEVFRAIIRKLKEKGVIK